MLTHDLKEYLNCMLRIPPLDDGALRAALRLRAHGEAWPGGKLEEGLLPLVVRWVNPYRCTGVDLLELIEVGNRAALKALRDLKPAEWDDAMLCVEWRVTDAVENYVLAKNTD